MGALAAIVALLPVPRVARDLDAGLLLVHLSVKNYQRSELRGLEHACMRLYECVLL